MKLKVAILAVASGQGVYHREAPEESEEQEIVSGMLDGGMGERS
jgi:hypothetical protein